MADTTEQTWSALNLANDIRSKRAAKKRELALLTLSEGRHEVAGLIEDPPDWMTSARVGDVLTWPRRTGRAYARRVLNHVSSYDSFPVVETRRLRDLTTSQRNRLAMMLRGGWDV